MENERYLTEKNNCDNVNNKRAARRIRCNVTRPLMFTTNTNLSLSQSSTSHHNATTKLNNSSSSLVSFGSQHTHNAAVNFSSLLKTLIATLNMFNINNKKFLFFAFVLFNSIIVLHSSRVAPKNLENFCRLYPLHRKCMGVFAAGGKRSMEVDDAKNYDDDSFQNNELRFASSANGVNSRTKNLNNNDENDDDDDDAYFLDEYKDENQNTNVGQESKLLESIKKVKDKNLRKKILLYEILKLIIEKDSELSEN